MLESLYMKQLNLLKLEKTEHGGSLSEGKRQSFRPLHTQKLVHLVLKCDTKISLYKNRSLVINVIRRQEKLAGVKIYDLSVQHDHIHHSILFSDRSQYKKFIRATTGILARKLGSGIWKYRPYTKLVEWGRQARNLSDYIRMNELEVQGLIPYQSRRRRK